MSQLGDFADLDKFDNDPDPAEDTGRDEFSNTEEMKKEEG